jgi:Family of unknown function (DUF5685)
MALLPAVPKEARTPAARATLGAFGRRLGSAIYLIDALDDLEKDHLGGAFNPCLLAEHHVSWSRVEMAWGMLHDDLAALDALAAALPLRRHGDLVRSVVAVELPRMAHAAAKRAHAHARADDARRRASLRAQTWPRRALAGMATIFVLLWVWLSSIPALARGPKRPSLPPGGHGAPAGSTPNPPASSSAAPEHWEPQLPPSSSAAPDSGSPPPPAEPLADAGAGAVPDAGAPGPTPGGHGYGCSNPCSGCGDALGSLCASCSGCCGACKGGDCGCTKVCDSCGSCGSCCDGCKSCNNCNCNGCCR